MNTNYKQALYEKFDQFRSGESTEVVKELLDIFNQIEFLDSEDWYLWGLTLYFSEGTPIDEALEKFQMSLKIDVDNSWSNLYAGHCYQDIQLYDKALEHYTKVDQEKLKELQLWRYLKLLEQIAFCHYQLGQKEKGLEQFKTLLELLKVTPEENRPVIVEALECLEETDALYGEFFKLNND